MKHIYLLLVLLAYTYAANAQYTVIPDANFETALAPYDDIPGDGQVPTSNINTLTFLSVENNNISSLNGIQDFTALEQLRCNDNNLMTLDLSQNLNLQRLRCYSNPLVNLDLSNNLQLFELRSYACPSLTSLNIANGNNSNINHLNISSNTNLTCVEVDNPTIANDWNNNINLPGTYSAGSSVVYCILGVNETYVPDDAFEAYLESNSLGNGIANDNRVDKSLISTVTSINLGNLGIIDAIGINEFVALETLQVNDNNLEVIYLDNLINLVTFRATRNNLVTLDLSNSTSLEVLIVDSNNLSTLLLNSTVLIYYQIAGNNFSSIDLTNFPLLERLFCGGNNILNLDVNSNPELITIECQNNDIESLDVSNNPDLVSLLAFSNALTSLDVKNGNNGIITTFRADNNTNLSCVEVDNEVAATNGLGNYSSWMKDAGTVYSEDCAATLGTNTFELNTISVYPNPVVDILNINATNNELKRLDILDINGRLVITKYNSFENVDMHQLNAGVYFMRLYNKSATKTLKLIKQ
ncbi:T9SS type A sorting domain-containing protein [uncultured Psychroserpens sp.]|uniref:T9SS type A sorting domain-containing protein n=1 Tax=uncultured Psychroserpens sp. TaxID=255436 RepID=UPI00262A32A8|nr:T9SS type A sorting domain-containing protein [uncultured Psychroserpens sp.]